MSDLPTRNEWEELGFSVPDELCAPTMEYESLPLEHCAEYDGAAEWCAIRGLKGKVGDPLPANMATNGALKYINADPESFEKRVRQFAYARAMAKRPPMKTEKNSFDQCTAERLEYEHMLAEHQSEQQVHVDVTRYLLKQMRFALNAFNDGCPELACEILGDTLRTYGEET